MRKKGSVGSGALNAERNSTGHDVRSTKYEEYRAWIAVPMLRSCVLGRTPEFAPSAKQYDDLPVFFGQQVPAGIGRCYAVSGDALAFLCDSTSLFEQKYGKGANLSFDENSCALFEITST